MSRISVFSNYNDSVVKKQRKLNTVKNNLIRIPNDRAVMEHSYELIELFDNIFRQLDELRQRCEDIEVRLNRIEQDVEFYMTNIPVKLKWYEV